MAQGAATPLAIPLAPPMICTNCQICAAVKTVKIEAGWSAPNAELSVQTEEESDVAIVRCKRISYVMIRLVVSNI